MKRELVAGMLVLVAGHAAGQTTFVVLKDLPGGTASASAHGISADGKWVVGNGHVSGGLNHACLWDELGEPFDVHVAADLDPSMQSFAMCYGGGTVFGSSDNRAFRWSAGAGRSYLPLPDGELPTTEAVDCSNDGTVVVGRMGFDGSPDFPCRWVLDAKPADLGGICEGPAYLNSVSGDGTVVTGESGACGFGGAIYWTEAAGWISLGDLPGGESRSLCFASSNDGSVLVGYGSIASGRTEAFRWTTAGGMVGIGVLPKTSVGNSLGYDCSDDGNTIVGDSGKGAFIWRPGSGIRELKRVLQGWDVPGLDNWTFVAADIVSGDGLTIVGHGQDPMDAPQLWKATIPACDADCSRDGRLSVNDFVCFQVKWREKHPYGDFDANGLWNVNDFIAFQAAFRGGCP